MSIGYKTPGEAHQQTDPQKKEWKVSMFLGNLSTFFRKKHSMFVLIFSNLIYFEGILFLMTVIVIQETLLSPSHGS